jgi:hypothetical protein
LNQEVRQYYFGAYHDLKFGFLTLEEAKSYLELFEELEIYEACEGIKLAIEDYERR